jgi:CHAT domain-containing protein
MILDYTLGALIEMDDSHDKAKYLISVALLIQDIQKKLNQPKDDLTYLAWQALEEAKIIGENLEDPRITSYAYGYLGQMYETQGTYESAMALTRSAVFFARQGNYPQISYLWHWQLARLFKAEGRVEDAIKAYQQTIEILNPIRKELFKGYRSREDIFNEKVKPVYLGLTGMLLEQAEKITDPAAQEAKLREARDVMELLKTAEIQDFFEDECVTEAQKKIKTIDRTPPHTAVIYPITLPKKLSLLLTLPDGLRQITVPVGSEEIRETVDRFRHRLQNRTNNRFLYESRQLYDWLIRPVESELNEYEVHTLVVAPDGALRMIPFSAMNDGTQFLVEKYAIATVPAISLTDLKPPDHSKFEILLSGLSESVQGASPLPSVPKELKDIKEIMNGKVLLQDKEHTAANLTREFKKQPYSIIHLATHGVFGGTPKDSFLLMYDSLLTMDLLENLISIGRFRDQAVELLTLSACQTAMGNERAALGLAGVAVKAGVRSAIATLWYVDDEATSLAIREFYRQLKTPGVSKVEALRNAQKKLISQPRYWHPLYWAPFLLIGNWL